ncbi:unnamed protein product [Cylicocyclus nassatus]|uniref:Sulfotransferase n=1 Tax=Cylicocyclus nassatus TaxID=53992 RepID=A0AA36DKL1_CYLNA|nr:unnamed protein product [Cylicocyclus nassatus]
MSGFRSALFCYLNFPKAFALDNKTMSDAGWLAPSCLGNNFTISSWQEVLRQSKQVPLVFLVTRNPFDRFVSLYMDKCVAWRRTRGSQEPVFDNGRCGCEKNLYCFLKKIYGLLLSLQPDYNMFLPPSKRFMSKSPFERYLIKHFAPMSWYCGTQQFLNSMHTIHLDMSNKERMAEKYDEILTLANVTKQQRLYIRTELLRELPSYATWNQKGRTDVENELLSNATLLELFLQLYLHDFMIFKYDFPTPHSTSISLCMK